MKRRLLFFFPLLSLLTFSSCSLSGVIDGQTTKSLYISSFPTKVDYNVGESFSLQGIKVIEADTGEEVLDYVSSIQEGYNFKESDISPSKMVNISKPHYKSATFNISVSSLPQLEISGNPKIEYLKGEYFTLQGLVVTCNNEVITGYTCNFTVGNALNTVGEFTVVISKDGYWPAEYTINVYPNHALTIETLPTKTSFDSGDSFTSEGLRVIDERGNDVTDYQLSVDEGTVLKYPGSFEVEVIKEDYESASYSITVNSKAPSEITRRDLTIYYLNDTHGSFIRNEDLNEAGISYISAYIKGKVSEDPNNSIVLSGGDMFQGGYESNETRGAIMIDAMNEIGFDAMVLGNHEFDWGEEYIYQFDEQLNCPIISANTFYSYDRTTMPEWISPYTVIERGDLRIGIIGGATQNMGTSITGSISDAFYFPAPNEYIKVASSALRQNEGCDIIIAALHDEGFEGYSGSPTSFRDLTDIDPKTNSKYVDAMFFAHDHMRKNGSFNDVPYLEAGCNGKNVGEMTLSIENSSGVYKVDDYSTEVIWAVNECTVSDPVIDALPNKPEYAPIIAVADEPIYTFKHSYSRDDFTDVVCMAMYWYVNNHKEDFGGVTIYLSSHNTGGIRSEVYAGVFTRRDLVKVIPFDNKLSIQTCTSTNINNLKNSSYYRTYQEGYPVYDDRGYTQAVSIAYITEYKYAYNYQVSYINYPTTAKEALIAYLLSGVNDSL